MALQYRGDEATPVDDGVRTGPALGEDFALSRGGRFLTDAEAGGLGMVNSQTGKTLSGATPFSAPEGFSVFSGTAGIPLDRPILLPSSDPIVKQTSGGGGFLEGLKNQALPDFAPGATVIGAGLGATAGLNALLGAGALGLPTTAAAGGAAGAGAAMPAAQALTPEALSSMGLVETAPGVFTAGGAAAGAAAGAGAAGGAAAGGAPVMPAAQPLSAGAAQSLGLQPAAMPGVSGATFAQGGAAAPSALSAGAGALAPGGTAPPVVGGAGTAAGAGGTAAGGSFVDSLMKQMKDNAVGLGLIGASTLMGASAGKAQIPNEQQIQALGTDAQGVAHQLIQQYQSGALSPGQQASLDQLTQNTKNQLKQYFASIGQGDSTASAQALAQVDQSALQMKQQILDTALQQGLSAIGVAQGPLNTIAQFQLGQDQQLRQAFGSFAGAVGNLFGRGAGTPQTSATASPTISSTQAPAGGAPAG